MKWAKIFDQIKDHHTTCQENCIIWQQRLSMGKERGHWPSGCPWRCRGLWNSRPLRIYFHSIRLYCDDGLANLEKLVKVFWNGLSFLSMTTTCQKLWFQDIASHQAPKIIIKIHTYFWIYILKTYISKLGLTPIIQLWIYHLQFCKVLPVFNGFLLQFLSSYFVKIKNPWMTQITEKGNSSRQRSKHKSSRRGRHSHSNRSSWNPCR